MRAADSANKRATRVMYGGAAVAFALALCMVLTACKGRTRQTVGSAKPAEPAEPAYGDTLVQGSIGDASVLIPMRAGDSASHAVASTIFDGLLTYDKNLEDFEPRLAKSWDVSKDGLEITFHLRKDVKWQDGQPFTTADIKFGFDTIRDPKTLTAYAEDFNQVSELRVQDKYTFTAVYPKPFAPALGSWGNLVVLPKHLLQNEDINTTEFGRHPVGLGAYKFDSWKTNEQISVISNHDYYRGRPYLDRLVWRIIPDQQTMFLELKGGGIDLTGLTPIQFKRQTETESFRSRFNKYTYLANGYTYLGYNLKLPLFQDARVRRALTHAIDKQEIIEGVLLGLGQATEGPYKPGTYWVNDKLQPYAYDPDEAKAMLAEAGWTDSDGDGILDKDGKKFSFELITNNGNEQRLKTATIIQRRLKKIGVDVRIKTLEWSAFINDYIDKRRFEAVILGWSQGPDPDLYDIWHSSKTGVKEFNFVSFKNEEADEMLEKGRRTFDKEERKRYYDRLQKILYEEQPYTFLYVAQSLIAVQSRIHGIEPAPAGIAYNQERWFVPQGLQRHTITQGP